MLFVPATCTATWPSAMAPKDTPCADPEHRANKRAKDAAAVEEHPGVSGHRWHCWPERVRKHSRNANLLEILLEAALGQQIPEIQGSHTQEMVGDTGQEPDSMNRHGSCNMAAAEEDEDTHMFGHV